jgi:hypothetical protein
MISMLLFLAVGGCSAPSALRPPISSSIGSISTIFSIQARHEPWWPKGAITAFSFFGGLSLIAGFVIARLITPRGSEQ